MHRNRNPCNSFLMVKIASGMDHGRVRPTTTTTNDEGFLVFIKEQRWFVWHLSHLSSRRNRRSFDRYPFDKNKLPGHVVSCCYTIHNVL